MNINNSNNFCLLINNNLPEPFFSDDSYLIMINCISDNQVSQLNYNYINLNDFSLINNIDLLQINLRIYNNFLNIEKNLIINNNLSGNDLYEIIDNSLKLENQYGFIKQLILNYQQRIEKDNNIIVIENNDVILVEIFDDILNINLNDNNSLNNYFFNSEVNQLDLDNTFDNLDNLINFLDLLNDTNNEDNQIENPTLTTNEFNNLSKIKYHSIKDKIKLTSCQICQDEQEFKDDDDILVLPCKHLFHYNCLQTWLLNYNNTCPLCRCNLSS